MFSGGFGKPATPAFGASGGSLFGSSAGSTFGSTGATAFGSAPAATSAFGAPTPAPAITGKTKFVDLPEAVQKQLVEIERQKAVQIQIGSSIIADETEREVRAVGQSVQRLAQELAVVKMTMSGDREMVEDAKQQVGFAVKHAEKGASLVAHATDDGSWAQSGLTPLQVATRQKALLALQVSDGQAALLRGTERSADDKQLRDGLSVDPYEAVRRIQVASMHYDAASEYYWAWLTRVESSAQLLAERLDQLERHVSSAVARQQQQSDDARDQPAARPTPRAVSDVIQYQNDSFIAIAGRVAALDDDVRRLRRRLGLKDGAAVPTAVHLLS
ncbi:hypothetical protein IWQ57_001716 [Coemansia nantahalensis]|uniref:Uncharacterized protein n=1 Tax=Coemansia nantahalensis TaxID=2789366 RepID=A0ACC1K2W4_9FUNG|nr:hypothetical protein IWQ57_001716 [Coemansia nantahalensis]